MAMSTCDLCTSLGAPVIFGCVGDACLFRKYFDNKSDLELMLDLYKYPLLKETLEYKESDPKRLSLWIRRKVFELRDTKQIWDELNTFSGAPQKRRKLKTNSTVPSTNTNSTVASSNTNSIVASSNTNSTVPSSTNTNSSMPSSTNTNSSNSSMPSSTNTNSSMLPSTSNVSTNIHTVSCPSSSSTSSGLLPFDSSSAPPNISISAPNTSASFLVGPSSTSSIPNPQSSPIHDPYSPIHDPYSPIHDDSPSNSPIHSPPFDHPAPPNSLAIVLASDPPFDHPAYPTPLTILRADDPPFDQPPNDPPFDQPPNDHPFDHPASPIPLAILPPQHSYNTRYQERARMGQAQFALPQVPHLPPNNLRTPRLCHTDCNCRRRRCPCCKVREGRA